MATGREPPEYIPACSTLGLRGYDVSLVRMGPRELPWVIWPREAVSTWAERKRGGTYKLLSLYFTVSNVFDLIRCGVDKDALIMRGDSIAYFRGLRENVLYALPVVSVDEVNVTYLSARYRPDQPHTDAPRDYHVSVVNPDGGELEIECSVDNRPAQYPRPRRPSIDFTRSPRSVGSYSTSLWRKWEHLQPSGPMPCRVLDERIELLAPHNRDRVALAQRLEVMWDRWGNWDRFDERFREIARELLHLTQPPVCVCYAHSAMAQRPRPPLVLQSALRNTLIDVSDIRLGHDRPYLPWALVTVDPVYFQLQTLKGGLTRKGFNCFEIYDLWDLLLVNTDAPGLLFRGDQLAVVVNGWPSGANVPELHGSLLHASHATVTLEEWHTSDHSVRARPVIRGKNVDVRKQTFTTSKGRVYHPYLSSDRDPRGPNRSTRVPNQDLLAGFIPHLTERYPEGPVSMRNLVKRMIPGIVRQYEEERRAWFEGETPEEEPYLSRKR